MGNRTVVVLYNDQTSEWEKDPDLGRKIAAGANNCFLSMPGPQTDLDYGRVVECKHADSHTLAILEGYRFNPVAHGFWCNSQSFEAMNEALLRNWADRLGFRLVKKSAKG